MEWVFISEILFSDLKFTKVVKRNKAVKVNFSYNNGRGNSARWRWMQNIYTNAIAFILSQKLNCFMWNLLGEALVYFYEHNNIQTLCSWAWHRTIFLVCFNSFEIVNAASGDEGNYNFHIIVFYSFFIYFVLATKKKYIKSCTQCNIQPCSILYNIHKLFVLDLCFVVSCKHTSEGKLLNEIYCML